MTTRRLHVETVPVEARGFQGRPAGLVTRATANVIDVAVVVLLLAAGYLGVAGFLFLRQGARFSFPIVSYQTAYVAGFVALVVYFAISWTAGGRTYGDRLLGLRVQTSAGDDVGVVRATLRAILCAVFPLLLVWAAIDRDNRSVQDLLARTRVIYDWGVARPASSDDAARMAVDVAPPVAHEPEHGDAEPLPRLDGQG
jgi:uncharacterized RDD family membrane protein YckC